MQMNPSILTALIWVGIVGPCLILCIVGLQFSNFWGAIGAMVGMVPGLLTVFVWKPWVK